MKLIVTGANGVLGRAVVAAALEDGFDVASIDRVFDGGFPANANPVTCDNLASPEAATGAFRDAVATLGGLDAVVHLVGGFEWVPFAEASLDTWRNLFATNVETTVTALQISVPMLSDGGAIVCVGAASAQPAGMGMAPYAAAKSGTSRIVEALSAELKPRRIRVNAVLPAIIDTPRNRADMPDADPAAWTSPAAVAETILFLASPQSRAINGAQVPVTNNA